jgi:hypothetical protein
MEEDVSEQLAGALASILSMPLRDMGDAVPVRRDPEQLVAGLRPAEQLSQDGLEIHATLPPNEQASYIGK